MDIVLSPRLRVIAEAVGVCDTVADIGTDHAFLPIRLVQSGQCQKVYASDIREKPLERAKMYIRRYLGDTSAVIPVLGDGFANLPEPCDVTVIAGMGGDSVIDILNKAPADVGRLVLQPMTSQDDLRRYLYENGYTITDETVLRDGFLYVVMTVEHVPCGPYEPVDIAFSRPLQQKHDALTLAYLKRQIERYETVVAGRKKAGTAVPYETEEAILGALRRFYDRDNS